LLEGFCICLRRFLFNQPITEVPPLQSSGRGCSI
jgi:hypothetical protein